MERIARMTEKTTEYDIGRAVSAAGEPSIVLPTIELLECPELNIGLSEWLKLPSGQYVNMARVDTVSGPFDESIAGLIEPAQVLFLNMGHTVRTARGVDIAAVLAYLDSVVVSP